MSDSKPALEDGLTGASTPRLDTDRTASRRPTAEITRQRLLEAGRAAFARRGLSGTNLKQDILKPAGIAVGSFYYQFRNKTDLLLAILEEDTQDLRDALQRAQEPGPGRSVLDITRDSYEASFDVAERHPDTMRILFRESSVHDSRIQQFAHEEQNRWIEILTHNFRRIASDEYETAQIELAAELISVLTTGALAHYLALPDEERAAARERLIDGLVRLTLGGLPALGVDDIALAALARPISSGAEFESPMPTEDDQT